jgi:pimeloyl-ACP methyl ester carboxylesterase
MNREAAGPRASWVDLGGLRLHVRESGPADAEPLLLVHGWPQHSGCWQRVADQLGDRYRCVMPDLRGFGLSDAPPGGYDKRQLGDDLVVLLDALELPRVGYVGHDWGGFIGFELALRAPERFTGLLALSIPHPWPSWHDRLHPLRLAAFAYQLPLSMPLLGQGLMRRGLARRILAHAAPNGTFGERELGSYDRSMSGERARVTVAIYRTFLLRELPSLARRGFDGRLEVTTRLLVGEHDPIVHAADLRGYEAHAEDMEVERVPGAGHFLPDERPELVAARARSLFRGQHEPAPGRTTVPSG